MEVVATILCAVGIIVVVFGFMKKFKAGRISKTPFVSTHEAANQGDALANPKGAISVEGRVLCDKPLYSPVTHTPCLYYELEVTGFWKEGDSKKSKKYIDEKSAAAFALDDGSGPIKVLADKGGDFDPMKTTFNETKKEGMFADLKGLVGKGKPIQFGNYAFQNPAMSKANEFKCEEKVFEVPDHLFALGKHQAGAIGSPAWASLILSTKDRTALLGSTLKTSKYCFVGGSAGLGMGVVLGLLATFVFNKPKEVEAAPIAQIESSAPETENQSAKTQPEETYQEEQANEEFFGLTLKPHQNWQPVWDEKANLAGWKNDEYETAVLLNQIEQSLNNPKSLKAAAPQIAALGADINQIKRIQKTKKGWWAVVRLGKDTDLVYMQKHKGQQFVCAANLTKPKKGKPIKMLEAIKICEKIDSPKS